MLFIFLHQYLIFIIPPPPQDSSDDEGLPLGLSPKRGGMKRGASNWKEASMLSVLRRALKTDNEGKMKYLPITPEAEMDLMKWASKKSGEPERTFQSFYAAVKKRATKHTGSGNPSDFENLCKVFVRTMVAGLTGATQPGEGVDAAAVRMDDEKLAAAGIGNEEGLGEEGGDEDEGSDVHPPSVQQLGPTALPSKSQTLTTAMNKKKQDSAFQKAALKQQEETKALITEHLRSRAERSDSLTQVMAAQSTSLSAVLASIEKSRLDAETARWEREEASRKEREARDERLTMFMQQSNQNMMTMMMGLFAGRVPTTPTPLATESPFKKQKVSELAPVVDQVNLPSSSGGQEE